MRSPAGRRALQALLAVVGVVMVVAGAATVLLGTGSVPDAGTVRPDVDSEMRFYAVWYVVAGTLLLRTVPRVHGETTIIRLVAGGFFVAGCARILSWIVVGRPHVIAIVLMGLELVLPLVIVPWQAGLARRAR